MLVVTKHQTIGDTAPSKALFNLRGYIDKSVVLVLQTTILFGNASWSIPFSKVNGPFFTPGKLFFEGVTCFYDRIYRVVHNFQILNNFRQLAEKIRK